MEKEKKILIVEDELITALDIKAVLMRNGFKVIGITTSANSTIEKIETEKPDIVLMDIMLKGEMSGIEAAKIIKEKYKIPIIIITASTDEKTFLEAKIINPSSIIRKPYIEKDLLVAINSLI